MKKVALILGVGLLMSCTDAGRARLTTIGSPAHIRCYSCGILIYEGNSTGKVKYKYLTGSYYFKDAKDRKLKEVSGNCVIEYLD